MKDKVKNKMVDAETLRFCFQPPVSMGLIRSLQYRRAIPFMRLGRRVYFDVEEVKAALKTRGAAR